MAPAKDAEWMEGVVAEALRAKAARAEGKDFIFELLGPKALDRRVGLGVRWGQYLDGGELRLKGHTGRFTAIAQCGGWVCSGSWDGSIRVWNMTGKATQVPERKLLPDGCSDSVLTIAVWDGHLISGHYSGRLMVWNVETGACVTVFKSSSGNFLSLAVCGSHLVSGSGEGHVEVWAMSATAPWTCERTRTLLGHTDYVWSLVGWKDKLLSGSKDKTIRVWDMETGEHTATLTGHNGAVYALAVHENRLFSSSHDRTIRMWALGTWAMLRTVACAQEQYPRCLAVSGSQLVSGSYTIRKISDPADAAARGELQVWDLQSLDHQHTLPQPAGTGVFALLAVEGGVWAGVGNDLVIWRLEA
jgi:WD40 repeat protein